MAVININSGGPEGKEREFGLTWSSDLPSVRKPYTRKAHIPEDDVVLGDGESSGGGGINWTMGDNGNVVTGTAPLELHMAFDGSVMPMSQLYLNLTRVTNLTIYVPAELLDDYKAADGWTDYADVIFAEPEEEETQEETPGEP